MEWDGGTPKVFPAGPQSPTPKSAASLTKFERDDRCTVKHISSHTAAI